MKATITQRFAGLPCVGAGTCEADAEADCRFMFLWQKDENGEWRARFVRHWYEEDKLIPVNPARVPELDEEKLKGYPAGLQVFGLLSGGDKWGLRLCWICPGTGGRAITLMEGSMISCICDVSSGLRGDDVDI